MASLQRVVLAACASLAALALASPAAASYTPRLLVDSPREAVGGSHETLIKAAIPETDDASAKITIYVASGYTIDLPAVGAAIGTAKQTLLVKEPAGTKVALVGGVKALDPNTQANRTLATGCTGAPAHEAVWKLDLSVGGTGINPNDVFVFVDRTTPAEAMIGSYKLQACFRSPDIPPVLGGQAQGGKPIEFELRIKDVFGGPTDAGDHTWRAIFTPYTAGTGVEDPDGTVESQAIVRLPVELTLAPKLKTQKRKIKGKLRTIRFLRLSGRISEGGTPLGGVRVDILTSSKSAKAVKHIRTLRTDEDGRYSVTIRVAKTTYIKSHATAAQRTTSCPQTPLFSCAVATVASFDVVNEMTQKVEAAKQRKPQKKLKRP